MNSENVSLSGITSFVYIIYFLLIFTGNVVHSASSAYWNGCLNGFIFHIHDYTESIDVLYLLASHFENSVLLSVIKSVIKSVNYNQ